MIEILTPTPLTAIGLVLSTTFATMNLILDNIAIPALLLSANRSLTSSDSGANSKSPPSSTLILRQWSLIQARGHYIGPPTALLSSAAYLASSVMCTCSYGKTLLRVAATLAFSVVPFTFVVILKVNDELNERSKREGYPNTKAGSEGLNTSTNDPLLGGSGKKTGVNADSEQDDMTLLAHWVRLNEIRAGLMAAATLLALLAIPFNAGR